ncbi:MAG: ribonuclease HI [Bacteroidia bacterium]|nr:ribonuclease HI [Bacteroidia bacterium]
MFFKYIFEKKIINFLKLTIYTDGASRGNPGNGGYGAVLIYGNNIKEISEGYILTTNNRMELMAVIAALKALKKDNLNIEIFTDSKYVMDAFEKKWIDSWQKKGFKNVKNPDLWKILIVLYKKHDITFKWVKGHSGNKYNERCDYLATIAADGNNLKEDEQYLIQTNLKDN